MIQRKSPLEARDAPRRADASAVSRPVPAPAQLGWLEGQTHLAAEPAAAVAKEFFLGR